MPSDKAELGFEKKLYKSCDNLRNNMDAAEYKHVILGLIFLKYVSDSFEEMYSKLVKLSSEGADPEDRDEYLSENVFWVPKEARWNYIEAHAGEKVGTYIDDAMIAIEKENPSLQGTLPKDYSRPTLNQDKLSQVVSLIGSIHLASGDNTTDILGRCYEFFLQEFAAAEGKKGGQFFTPHPIVNLLVEMLEPRPNTRILDPCCGSGGMFVQSEAFIKEHGGKIGDVAIYGQESNPTTWRLAKMNLAIRAIPNELGPKDQDSFTDDLFPSMKFDYIIANPPFNMKEWGYNQLKDDVRWKKYGLPPEGNGNYAWIQHFIHHLAPNGLAGFVLANGSLSSNQAGEGEIRQKIIEDGIVDCIVSLPPKMFYSTPVGACLWFISRNKQSRSNYSKDKILFIDARSMGFMIDRTHRSFSSDDINKISNTYHSWKSGSSDYSDVEGYCKSASMDDIKKQKFTLVPGRYVGLPDDLDEDISFDLLLDRELATLQDYKLKIDSEWDDLENLLRSIKHVE